MPFLRESQPYRSRSSQPELDQPGAVATPFEMIGIVGVVAPGPGSIVSARMIPSADGSPVPSK